jgi:hypothetical protein
MPQNNIGLKKYNFLVQVDTLTGRRTGERKPNIPSDTDYIEPVWDEFSCPIPLPSTTTTTTTTSTTTTTTTSTTTTTTTTTVKEPVYAQNIFKCKNSTKIPVTFKLFSSISNEDLLESLLVESNSLSVKNYNRDINNTAKFSIDIIPSQTTLLKVNIKILVNDLVICDLKLDSFKEVFEYNLGEFFSEPIEIILIEIPERIYSEGEYSSLYA